MALTKISEQTVTGAAYADFTSGIDSTYKLYKVIYNNINPDASSAAIDFVFQTNQASGSGWNETIMSTFFKSEHHVGGATGLSPGATESVSGEFYLFNPSGTTYVKHWWSVNNGIYGPYTARGSVRNMIGGYFNITAAIDGVRFKFSDDGNFDGYFSLWGL
jgi:hypothetical protein